MNFFPDLMETTPMDPAIKEQWTKALRSGEYKQGELRLNTAKLRGGAVYCCLGVLCDLHNKTTGEIQWSDLIEASEGSMVREYDGARNYIPGPVQSWSRLSRKAEMALSEANDMGANFSAIADWIEGHL